MTIKDYIWPMPNLERIIFLTYTDAELLDLSGPLSVFSAAQRLTNKDAYECIVTSATGGIVRHSCGTGVDTLPFASIRFRTSDTVLVVGAGFEPIKQAIEIGAITQTLIRAANKARRYGSICTGSYLLGAAGLLEGKRVTTHWAAKKQLQQTYRNASIDGASLYVCDGKLWSSAGVTTGIDMALAMVEQDFDSNLKSRIAKLLVLYSHRPGSQSQFSDILHVQSRAGDQFRELVNWLAQRIDRPTQVHEMAAFANMSVRSFSRKFKYTFDTSPAKFFERLRLDHARELLSCGETPKLVAGKIGFASHSAFRSAFKDTFGVTPGHYSTMSTKK